MGALLPSSNWPGLLDSPDLRVTAGAWSVRGTERDKNEDCEYISPKHDLFIVADGMGGHAAGELASKFVVDTLTHELERLCDEPHTTGEIKKLVSKAIKEAHCLVVEMGDLLPAFRGSGSTVVLSLIFGHHLFVAGVGDSMAYLLRNGYLANLTEDDSYCAVLEKTGVRSHQDTKTHPARSQLLAALGLAKFPPNNDIKVLEVQPNDRYLLCTDGVTDVLEMDEMQHILTKYANPRVAAQQMVEAAVRKGSTDDATCLVFAIHKVARRIHEAESSRQSVANRFWQWLLGNAPATT